MGKVASSDYPYCPGISDDANHTFFECDRWLQRRRYLEVDIEKLSSHIIVQVMLRSEENWNLVFCYMKGVLKSKKAEEDLAAYMRTTI